MGQLNIAFDEDTLKGAPSLLTWEDFLHDCGPKTSLGRQAMQERTFQERYKQKTFSWQGQLHSITEGADLYFMKTNSLMILDMDPPRYPSRSADVVLLFSEARWQEVAKLVRGDWVRFEATFMNHGQRGQPEIFLLWHIEKVPRPHELPLDTASAEAQAVQDDASADAQADAERDDGR